MPYYYLISEVPESRDDPVPYDFRTYKKPKTINLLLPSIHASREDNILDAGSPAEDAVRCLQISSRDSESWPSSEYLNSSNNDSDYFPSSQTPDDSEPRYPVIHQPGQTASPAPEDTLKAPPVFAKYRPPSWAYDSVRPELLEAARALFYERKRQQAMYSGASPWNQTGYPRYPTDYELFAAWASLPRSDKLTYVAEVSGSNFSNTNNSDSLSTQRAVTSLLASCPDSCSWPSFQFSRIQAQHRPLPPPPQRPYPYQPYHNYHHQTPMFSNPLPFKLD